MALVSGLSSSEWRLCLLSWKKGIKFIIGLKIQIRAESINDTEEESGCTFFRTQRSAFLKIFYIFFPVLLPPPPTGWCFKDQTIKFQCKIYFAHVSFLYLSLAQNSRSKIYLLIHVGVEICIISGAGAKGGKLLHIIQNAYLLAYI